MIDEEFDIEDFDDLNDDINSDINEHKVSDDDSDFLNILSKHKEEGKHSLKWDSIFKGKKVESNDEGLEDFEMGYNNDNYEIDKSSNLWTESQDNEYYIRQKKLKEVIFEILSNKTNINFLNNRRKPSRIDFNSYYQMVLNNTRNYGFTHIEIFNELSVYFSDNLFNMFKLLDNEWRLLIIKELREHIGNTNTDKKVTNRNIYEGTEIEFRYIDILGNDKIYTGVVNKCYYDISTFQVDSYENIYEVNIKDITKILNNSKFKNNLSKLDNIDFI